jgi:hypothetical protein
MKRESPGTLPFRTTGKTVTIPVQVGKAIIDFKDVPSATGRMKISEGWQPEVWSTEWRQLLSAEANLTRRRSS